MHCARDVVAVCVHIAVCGMLYEPSTACVQDHRAAEQREIAKAEAALTRAHTHTHTVIISIVVYASRFSSKYAAPPFARAFALASAGNMRASSAVSEDVFSTTPFPEERLAPGSPCIMKMQHGYHVAANMHNCSHGGRHNLCLDCGDGVLAARAETCVEEVATPEEAVKRCMADQMCEAVTVDQWKRAYYATESTLHKT
eukprot:5898833-Amphidinium_carterae.1